MTSCPGSAKHRAALVDRSGYHVIHQANGPAIAAVVSPASVTLAYATSSGAWAEPQAREALHRRGP